MNLQTILVSALFVLAIWYIGRIIYRSFSQKGGSCGSCNGSKCNVDFTKLGPKEN